MTSDRHKQPRYDPDDTILVTLREPLLTAEQIAAYCQVNVATVYRWIHEQRLRGLRAGDQWRVKPADLRRFLGDTDEGRSSWTAPDPDPSAVA